MPQKITYQRLWVNLGLVHGDRATVAIFFGSQVAVNTDVLHWFGDRREALLDTLLALVMLIRDEHYPLPTSGLFEGKVVEINLREEVDPNEYFRALREDAKLTLLSRE